MILRKPYALFIKYFKLMHLVMTILTGYLMYKTGFLYTFFSEKISSVSFNDTYDLTDKLFNFYMLIIPFIIILISLLISSVLIFKKKPYKFYILNILVFVGAIVMNSYFYDVLGQLETGYVEVRSLRLVRDFIMFTLIFEGLTLIKNAISATGFDVKKFDFRKDLEELKVEDEDREEFELDVKIDTDAARRSLRGSFRHTKYVYLENRFVFNLIALVAFSFISFTVYFNVSIYNKTLSENSAFTVGSMSMMITNSYVVNTDYKGVKISEDNSLVVLEISVRNNYEFNNKLEIARTQLDISGKKFIHTEEYRDRLFDLGISYDDSNLTTSFTKYILVYEVPNVLVHKNLLFMYYDNINYFSGEMGPSLIKVKVNPKYLEEDKKTLESGITKEVVFSDPLVKTTFKIDEYAVEKSFALDYNYCATKDECYPSKEYIAPGYNGNDNLMLLRVKGSLVWNEELKHTKYTSITKFIYDFGYLEYTTAIENKKFKIKNEVLPVKAKTDYIYLEIPADVFDSTSTKLVLNIRNNKYVYTLK